MAHLEQVEKDLKSLVKFIKKLGERNDNGQFTVKFGVLFDDHEAANTFEAINGTLRTAKKRQIIDFKGQMLLKGPHDNVPIILLVKNDDDIEQEKEPEDTSTDDTNTTTKEEEPKNAKNGWKGTENPNKLNTSFWDSAFKKDDNTNKSVQGNMAPKKVNIYGKTFSDDKGTEIVKKPETVIIGGDQSKENGDDENKEDMVQVYGRCKQAGCKCNKFIENTSKWSKGKCKSCGHGPNVHQMKWVKKSEICEEVKPKPKPQPTILPKAQSPSPSPGPHSAFLAESVQSPISDTDVMVKEEEDGKEEEKEEDIKLENRWGDEFTLKLGQCVTETFAFDEKSILPAKYLLHYLKKRIGFDFTGQTKHRDALQFVCVEQFGWKAINDWGYSIRVV